jgi:hypothetical protein
MRSDVENSDHRHPRLLRLRRQRPRGRRAAEQGDELASFQFGLRQLGPDCKDIELARISQRVWNKEAPAEEGLKAGIATS